MNHYVSLHTLRSEHKYVNSYKIKITIVDVIGHQCLS